MWLSTENDPGHLRADQADLCCTAAHQREGKLDKSPRAGTCSRGFGLSYVGESRGKGSFRNGHIE